LSAFWLSPLVTSSARKARSVGSPAAESTPLLAGVNLRNLSEWGWGPGMVLPPCFTVSPGLPPCLAASQEPLQPPRKEAVRRTSAPVCNNLEGGDLQMSLIREDTSPLDRESRKRIGTSHKFPNSPGVRRRDPYPDGLPADSTRTSAPRSEVGKSPKSITRPPSRETPVPIVPDGRWPWNGRARSRSLTQQRRGVPPRGSQTKGSNNGKPGGYQIANVHRPEVDPPVSQWPSVTERADHPKGGVGMSKYPENPRGPPRAHPFDSSSLPSQKNRWGVVHASQ
jgi:hypothetical protein